jgi:hypothetical protein
VPNIDDDAPYVEPAIQDDNQDSNITPEAVKTSSNTANTTALPVTLDSVSTAATVFLISGTTAAIIYYFATRRRQ